MSPAFAYNQSDGRLTCSPGCLECHDFKGVETPVFRLKAKLFRDRYPTVPLRLIRAGEDTGGAVG